MEDSVKTAHSKVDEIKEILEKAVSELEKKREAFEKEKSEFEIITKKIEKVNFASQITLDVGGEKFTTSLPTLQSDKNSFFAKMFSGNWKLETTKEGAYFIDRDGTYFRHILNFLRRGEIVVTDEDIKKELLIEAEYYQIQGLISILKKAQSLFESTTLLSTEQQKKLNEWFGNSSQNWKLLYKGSTHGFAAQTFHNLCNNQGPTYTIIKSTGGYIFGGYTPISWSSRGGYAWDNKTFLFTLTNPNGIPPTKYPNTGPSHNNTYSIHDQPNYGPTFGGNDIYIANQCNANNSTNFPHSFSDTTGYGKNTFTGNNNFQVLDIEVFTCN